MPTGRRAPSALLGQQRTVLNPDGRAGSDAGRVVTTGRAADRDGDDSRRRQRGAAQDPVITARRAAVGRRRDGFGAAVPAFAGRLQLLDLGGRRRGAVLRRFRGGDVLPAVAATAPLRAATGRLRIAFRVGLRPREAHRARLAAATPLATTRLQGRKPLGGEQARHESDDENARGTSHGSQQHTKRRGGRKGKTARDPSHPARSGRAVRTYL